MLLKLAASLLGGSAAYLILKAVYAELVSPLRSLPGPRSTHWFFGNLKELMEVPEDGTLIENWVQKYGHTFKIHLPFGRSGVFTSDTRAIHHFLSHPELYELPPSTRQTLRSIVGPGLLVAKGDAHKQQRKIMNPAFGAPQVRDLTEIFTATSIQLRDIWAAEATKNGGVARVEILSWLSKATLDIIGLAGFNYKINALGAENHDAPDELANAFEEVFKAETTIGLISGLRSLFPVLRRLSMAQDRVTAEAQATMMRIGRQLLTEAKREIRENGTFAPGHARDLLTLLVRANTSKDIPAHQRLSDEDVIAQVPTFLVAGHETTSTAVTWALFALTQNIPAQSRLRDELLGVSTDNPTMDELNALPYLECVVRESLRLYAPVIGTSRVAVRDDVVPLSAPIIDVKGNVHETLRIPKGTIVPIPILTLNRDIDIWGSNVMEFVPERWETPPANANSIPGVWGHVLTFLGGPRSCIGFRFSLIETKALIFTLVRAFEFELAVPSEEIASRKEMSAIVQRPVVLTDEAAGYQMPLLVKPVGQ
ncbi:cytochrome P450 [Mycena metata]|uniref:Cytochrome P450 n=1 Tax=Mycena metata TaxID=1033252 RepID=A0AAD7NXF1_9AGAR|nr:cytochrome P450 [Mycena metata]